MNHKYQVSAALIFIFLFGYYAFGNTETIQERIDRENITLLTECLISASNKSTSQEILQAKDACSNDILTKIVTGTASLTPVSEVPPSTPIVDRWKGLDEKNIVISDWLNSQEIEYIASLQNKVCTKQKNSPLCKEEWLIEKLYIITEHRLPGKNFFPILLGITNAESSLGLDFAKDNVGGTCIGRNNWGGTKYQINDDNTRNHSRSLNGYLYGEKYSGRYVDQFGCNLFPFESIEEYWKTKVNGIRFGYKACVDSTTPIRCLSGKYVGDPNVQEQSWINNVSIFL